MSFWIRLDVDFDKCGWLFAEDELVRFAFECFLRYTKFVSTGGGRVKRVQLALLQHEFRFKSVEPIKRMLEVASQPWTDDDGNERSPAIRLEDGYWVVSSWDEYQNPDAVRKQKEREEAKRQEQERTRVDATGQDGVVRTRPDALSCATSTSTLTITSTEQEVIEKQEKGDTPKPPSPSAPLPKKPRTIFVKPSKEDLANYFRENGGSGPMAKDYWDHYESNGWKVGGNKMVDWQAAVRKWISRDRTNPRASPNHGESISEVLAKNPWRQKPQDPEVQAIGQ